MTNKISPYSNAGVHKALYHSMIEEWVGLSFVVTEDNKNFSDLIQDIITLSSNQSELFFDPSLISYVEKHKTKRMASKKEFSTKSFETKELENLEKRLKKQKTKNEEFNFLNFNESIYEKISLNYRGLENLKPKKLLTISENNIEKHLLNIKETRKERLNSFRGFSCKRKETFHFVDAITAPIVYYNKTNEISSIETMIMGMSSYILKLNEIKNTKLLIKKLEEIEKNDLKISDMRFHFGQFSKSSNTKIKEDKVLAKDIDKIFKRKID